LLRGALARLLSREPDLRVVAELGRGDGVVAAVAVARPQVAVLDAGLPGLVTVGELCRRLHRAAPQCHPLVLLDPQTGGGLGRSLAPLVPWLGLLTIDAEPAGLVAAVGRLARGEPLPDAGFGFGFDGALGNPLTERESGVLRLAGHGAPPKEIARRLDLHPGTVRNHLSRCVRKTGARTRLEAIRIARESGWI
jgi:two-component system response regulator DesR